MGGPNKVGELHVDITAKGVAPTVAEINKVKEAGNAAAASTKNAAQAIKETTKPVRDFQQAIRGVVSSMFGWLAIIGTITTAIGLLVNGLRKAWDATTGLTTAIKENDEAIRRAAKTASESAAKAAVDIVPQPSLDRIKEAEEAIPRLTRNVENARGALEIARQGGPSAAPEITGPLEAALAGEEEKLKQAQDLVNRVNQEGKANREQAALDEENKIGAVKDAQLLADLEVAAKRRQLREVDASEQREIIREIEQATLDAIRKEREEQRTAAAQQREFMRELLAEQRRAFQESLNQMVLPMQSMVLLLQQIKGNTRN